MPSQANVIELLEAGLRGVSLRQAVIANNLSNLDTPGFRRMGVEFEKCLREALDSSRPADLSRIAPEVVAPLETAVNANGNDVDLDSEIGGLIKNTAMHKFYLRLLGKAYEKMDLATRTP